MGVQKTPFFLPVFKMDGKSEAHRCVIDKKM